MRYRLRALRLQRELTIKQTAIAIGLTKSAYSNIESGRRGPSWEVAQRLEKFFGIPASELLAESERQQS